MKKIFLIIYMFIAIFQPPVIPISLVYVSGGITLLYFLIHCGRVIPLASLKKSGIFECYRNMMYMLPYLLVVSIIDIVFIKQIVLWGNRLRGINQLVVLTGLELLFVCFILHYAKKNRFSYDDIIEAIGICGALQGVTSILAYIFPGIRSCFLTYQSSVFLNPYVIERRGYGFSSMLLDTYGYGMALIAGIVLLSNKFPLWKKAVYITLAMISVVLNARTGLVVFFIALVIYLFQASNRENAVLKGMVAIPVIAILVLAMIPSLVIYFQQSNNTTISWVANAIAEIYRVIFSQKAVNEATFLSDFSHIPTSVFGFLFGAGHNVYGISEQLGFHSDIGYINLLWQFGVIGSLFVFMNIIGMFKKASHAHNVMGKYTILFLLLSYFVVMIKAILIGYNPGVVITYLVCFASIYFEPKIFMRKGVKRCE